MRRVEEREYTVVQTVQKYAKHTGLSHINSTLSNLASFLVQV